MIIGCYLKVFLMFCFQAFLATMVANIRELILWNRHLSLFNNVYEFSMIIVPSIIVAPRYFSGEVRPLPVAPPSVLSIDIKHIHIFLCIVHPFNCLHYKQSVRACGMTILSWEEWKKLIWFWHVFTGAIWCHFANWFCISQDFGCSFCHRPQV